MNSYSNKYPTFSSIVSKTQFDGHSFLFVYHLNTNNAPFLESWIRKSKTLGIISIPYSETKTVKQRLEKYTSIFSPKHVDEIPHLILDISKKYKNEKITIVEVGGYSSFVSKDLTNVILSVEDTFQGHWLQENNPHLTYPVISIADTEVKKLENRLIGESITRTIERLLKKYQPALKLKRKTFAVVSYGGIGSSVCLALRNRKIVPYVYDIDVVKVAHAFADGYKIAERNKILSIADIIIACTGKTSITIKDLTFIKTGSFLFSGSSKQVEFQNFISLIKRVDSKELQKITYNGKYYWLGYYGQPINFLDTLLPETFDVQMATLLECFNYGVSHRLKNKVYSLPIQYQKSILELYIGSKY